METYEQAPLSLQIDSTNNTYLREAAKWAKFLSIVGFIGCGLMIVLAFFIGTIMSSLSPLSQMGDMEGVSPTPGGGFPFMGSSFITILYLIIAAVYLLPCLYLYRFAEKMQIALTSNDQSFLTSSFVNLKSLFKFMGVFTIVVLCIYGIGILVAIVSFAFMF